MATAPPPPGPAPTGEPTAAPAVDAASSRKALTAGAIGNFVEWYDFVLYGASAPILAAVFFGAGDLALLSTYAGFGVAFLARPFGAVILSNLGDRVGRRNVLAGVVLTVSVGTALIGVLPTYAAIGLWAPVLLVLIRALQGFTAGGEYGGSTAFIIEYAPAGKRGRYGSWQTATVALGAAAASLAVVITSASMGEEALYSWGWRIPFLLALPIGVIGLVLRLRMEDTPEYRRLSALKESGRAATGEQQAPVAVVFREHGRLVALGAAIVVGGTVSTYVYQNYVPTYLSTQPGGLTVGQGQLANMLGLLVYGAAALYFGQLSDRVGRRPLVLWGSVATAVLLVPIFLVQSLGGGLLLAILGQAAFGLAIAPVMGVLPVLLADFFPTEVRMSGLSMAYTISNALFGGTAPLVVVALVTATGAGWVSAGYCVVAMLVTLVAATRLRAHHESAPGAVAAAGAR